MKTWADVQLFINKHRLPYTIIRFNMSLQGRLIETASGETIAKTVKDAANWLKARA